MNTRISSVQSMALFKNSSGKSTLLHFLLFEVKGPNLNITSVRNSEPPPKPKDLFFHHFAIGVAVSKINQQTQNEPDEETEPALNTYLSHHVSARYKAQDWD